MTRSRRLGVIASVCALAVIAMAFVPPIAQPIGYHRFADTRSMAGWPNFWNVVSNIPFLFVGLLGLFTVTRGDYAGGLRSLRWVYGVFFVGLAAVSISSGYYHWAPSNGTLAWDRLPMAVAFMAMVSIVIGEHIHEGAARAALVPLVLVGIVSVGYWDYTERMGRGDLRLYALVQFLSLAFIAMTLLLLPSRLSGQRYLWLMFGGYAAAKVLEELDRPIFNFTGEQMSGHALKHVAAAIGMFAFVVALKKRRPMPAGARATP